MNKPEKFISSTDYATLLNDSVNTVDCVVSIPATSHPGGGATQTYTGIVVVGVAGAPMKWDINYSISSRVWKSHRLSFVENTGTANQYQGNVDVFRDSPTTAKVVVTVFRGGAGAITKNARTITVRIHTYLPPFA